MSRKLFIPALLSALIVGTTPAWSDIRADAEKTPGWVFQYEHDSAGTKVNGNIRKLISAVRSGGDVKIALGDNWIECTQTGIALSGADEVVFCFFTGNNMLSDEINPVFRGNPEITFNMINTLGRTAVLRVAINGHTNAGQSTGTAGARWYATVGGVANARYFEGKGRE
jgi:hypothetical protein